MVQQDIKSAQLEKAIDTAEQAIIAASQAERLIHQASGSGDPSKVAHAEGNLNRARQVVQDAIEHLKGTADEHREQQVVQVLDQLYSAQQDLEAAFEANPTPKQIR